jgi:uncharacterized protein (DUF2235 family)
VIYLIGFSRGAFTVRVLAGLVHRCGVLRKARPRFSARFREAYRRYKPHVLDDEQLKKVESFKSREQVHTPCIRFLGIWDTVKAYGGIWPKSLPHLRRNPSVDVVRHALSLDEERSWYIPTSWGGIDSDLSPLEQRQECRRPQHVEEIWFRGSHSDVGGGLKDDRGSKAPLRWMLNEAASAGLVLNEAGWRATTVDDPTDVKPFPSLNRWWLLTEYIPRWELDNHFTPPKRFFKCGRTGKRNPAQFSRQQVVRFHSTVGAAQDIVAEYVATSVATPHRAPRSGEITT